MQKDITNEVLELIRRTSSSLPTDVEDRLRASIEKEEPGSAARGALETIMKNIELSRANSTPICQDTGTPIFYVHYPEGWSTRKLKEQIRWLRDRFELTILLVEHNMQVVMGVCEHVHCVDHGVTIADGTPDHVQNHPAVLGAYLGMEEEEARMSLTPSPDGQVKL